MASLGGTRQRYTPKYISIYASRIAQRSEQKQEAAAPLERLDIQKLQQEIADFRQEIQNSPVKYPPPKLDPNRRFPDPSDMSRFERLRKGLRRDPEDTDINLGANYTRYRYNHYSDEEDEPEIRPTRTARASRPTQNERARSKTRVATPPKSVLRTRQFSPPPAAKDRPSEPEPDFEDSFPAIKQEEEDTFTISSYHPMPQLRRYAGYNSQAMGTSTHVNGSPRKSEQSLEEGYKRNDNKSERNGHEVEPEKHVRSTSSRNNRVDTGYTKDRPKTHFDPQHYSTEYPRDKYAKKAAVSTFKTAQCIEDEFERRLQRIERDNGPAAAREFIKQYKNMLESLSQEYYDDYDTRRGGRPVEKKLKFALEGEWDSDEAEERPESASNDKKQRERGRKRDAEAKRDAAEEAASAVSAEALRKLEKELSTVKSETPARQIDTTQRPPAPTHISFVARATHNCLALLSPTTSPLLLLLGSFFFWQAIRLYVFVCLRYRTTHLPY